MRRSVRWSIRALGLLAAGVSCTGPGPCVDGVAVVGLSYDIRHHLEAVQDLSRSYGAPVRRIEVESGYLIAGLRGLAAVTRDDAPDAADRFEATASALARVEPSKRQLFLTALGNTSDEFQQAFEDLPPGCGTANDDG